jgi:hypothetical protein
MDIGSWDTDTRSIENHQGSIKHELLEDQVNEEREEEGRQLPLQILSQVMDARSFHWSLLVITH